jgi:hypothetical protein
MPRGGKRPGAGRKPKPQTEPPKEKKLPWRPSKYDPAFCDMVIEAMQEGFSLTGFAGQIGVSRSTIGEWMNEYPNAVGRRGGGPGTAQIIQFMLKNNAPDEYREKVAHEHSGPGGTPIQTISTAMTPKEAADAYAATLHGDD